jgi:Fe-S-cluster containining protein
MGDRLAGTETGLTILDDPCRGCGACCEYVGAPPGYEPAYEMDEETPPGWWQTENGRAWLAMPPELRGTLDIYYQAVRDGVLEDRELAAEPCLWYDPTARRCSHYLWRPTACSDFQAGADDCLGVREYAGR